MQALIKELVRFARGEATPEQFRSACRDYLAANPNGRTEAVNWFQKAIAGGRVAASTYDLVADLFAPPVRAAAVAGGARTEWRAEAFTEVGQLDMTPTLQVGDVLLGGRYSLVEELGRGGMGQVFKARDRNLERLGNQSPFVALKALSPAFSKDENARSALQSEVLNAKRLAQDNIIRVNDFDWDGPHLIISMEYLKGHPLDKLIRTEYEAGMSIERAWNEVIRSVGAALEYAHGKGVVHSDIKPGNIFITNKKVVKVLDFGISRPMAQSASTNETILDGILPINGLSVAYACLEQWNPDQEADPRDDIYAFALVIYELLTGHHPFAKSSAKSAYESGLAPQRIESLSRKQWDALRQAMAFEREQRTKRVKDLVAALEPPTVYRKYRSWILGAAALTAVVAVTEGSHLYSDHVTQTMLNNRVRPPPAVNGPLTQDQKNEITSLTGLAEDELGTVNPSSSADDLSYVLSEGANNANDILDAILRIDARNERAATLKAHMAELYLKKAKTLADAGDYRGALTMVTHGRKVMPTSLDLFKMQQHICEQQADICAALPN